MNLTSGINTETWLAIPGYIEFTRDIDIPNVGFKWEVERIDFVIEPGAAGAGGNTLQIRILKDNLTIGVVPFGTFASINGNNSPLVATYAPPYPLEIGDATRFQYVVEPATTGGSSFNAQIRYLVTGTRDPVNEKARFVTF